MRRAYFVLVVALFVAGAVFFLWRLLQPTRAGVDIESSPAGLVYLNGRQVGRTPYQNYHLRPGNWQVRLVTEDKRWTWERTLSIPAGTKVLIRREFRGPLSQGRVVYLLPSPKGAKASCFLTSLPPKASVTIDGEMKGFTPLSLADIGAGNHHFIFALPNRDHQELELQAVAGRRLVAEVDFGPAKLASATPTPAAAEKKVKIKETPTGWLRVREKPTRASPEVARVNPGQEYPYLDERDGWFEIEYQPGKTGWVSGRYAAKVK